MVNLQQKAIEIIRKSREVLSMLDEQHDYRNWLKIHSEIKLEMYAYIKLFSHLESFDENEFKRLCWS